MLWGIRSTNRLFYAKPPFLFLIYLFFTKFFLWYPCCKTYSWININCIRDMLSLNCDFQALHSQFSVIICQCIYQYLLYQASLHDLFHKVCQIKGVEPEKVCLLNVYLSSINFISPVIQSESFSPSPNFCRHVSLIILINRSIQFWFNQDKH